MTVLEYDYEESENFLLKCLNLSLVIARKMVLTVAQKIRWKKIYFHLYLVFLREQNKKDTARYTATKSIWTQDAVHKCYKCI